MIFQGGGRVGGGPDILDPSRHMLKDTLYTLVGQEVLYLVKVFIYFHTLDMREVNALVRLPIYPAHYPYAISTKLPCDISLNAII